MVVISKESLLGKKSRLQRGLFSLGRFLRFLCLASFIPSLFWLRWYISLDESQRIRGATGLDPSSNSQTTLQGSSISASDESLASSSHSWKQMLRDTFHFQSRNQHLQLQHSYHQYDWSNDEHAFDVLSSTLQDANYPQNFLLSSISDIAELYYCRINDYVTPNLQAFTNFTTWAKPLLNESLSSLLQKPNVVNSAGFHGDFLQQEFIVELLEIYAQQQLLCDYSQYEYAPILDKQATTKLQQWRSAQQQQQAVPADSVRIAFCIMVRDDVKHLERLLARIVEPWHVVILHLEKLVPVALAKQVKRLAGQYTNVAFVQFGTIVYKTDAVSVINLRVMRWLVQDLKLSYDYHVTTSASVYPLVRNIGQALMQQSTDRKVWLGETYLNGQVVYNDQSFLLKQKRLIYSRGPIKLHKRLAKQPFVDLQIPDDIQASFMYKSNSGNHGIYAFSVLQELLESVPVKQLFVMSKYACCCCLEERNWIAALDMIGYGQEAREQSPAIFQLWGGVDTSCQTTMKKAVLSENASLCYRMEDATMSNQDGLAISGLSLDFLGNETLDYLKDAKARGVFFARKFRSDDQSSVKVLRRIEEEVW